MFIVIEKFGGNFIVTNQYGLTKTFEFHHEAQTEANKCQEAIVVPLDGFERGRVLLSEASAFIDVIRFDEGEDVDEENLEGKINDFLAEYDPGSLTQEGIINILK